MAFEKNCKALVKINAVSLLNTINDEFFFLARVEYYYVGALNKIMELS